MSSGSARDILYGRRGGGWADGPAKHVCHAEGCSVSVPPRMLMCARHWRMVPKDLQQRVWATYVPGQELRKNPTSAYLAAAMAAIAAVAERDRPATPAAEALSLFDP